MNKYQKALWNIIQRLDEYSPTDNYVQDLIIIQELVDKATPMRPRIEEDMDFGRSQYGLDYYVCPNCENEVEDTYCPHCGQALDWQALDWSEEDD